MLSSSMQTFATIRWYFDIEMPGSVAYLVHVPKRFEGVLGACFGRSGRCYAVTAPPHHACRASYWDRPRNVHRRVDFSFPSTPTSSLDLVSML